MPGVRQGHLGEVDASRLVFMDVAAIGAAHLHDTGSGEINEGTCRTYKDPGRSDAHDLGISRLESVEGAAPGVHPRGSEHDYLAQCRWCHLVQFRPAVMFSHLVPSFEFATSTSNQLREIAMVWHRGGQATHPPIVRGIGGRVA